jgi:tRNA (cmo5U34)-methyltransferase
MDIPEIWTFEDKGVAASFDEHVREQLPWYDMATRAVAHFIKTYLPEDGVLIDVGASNGNIARAAEDTIVSRNVEVIPIEPSAEMAATYNGPGWEHLSDHKAEDFQFEFCEYDVVVFMLSLMFIAPAKRAPLLEKIATYLKPGGAIIIVDKTATSGGEFGSAMWRLTLAEKIEAGADHAKVLEKELSLMGIQRPLPCGFIEDFGGKEFFRFGDFAGWVVEKH